MKIQESAQNYLETILVLKERNGSVRSIDIVHELGFSKPSISIAMKGLREDGYIAVDDHGYIELTSSGLDIADRIYDRHRVLSEAFIAMGVNEKTAVEDACKIEHFISEETFQKIKEHLNKVI